MNELQNDVAGALCWLRILMIAATDLHWLALLILSSFPDLGASSAEPPMTRRQRIMQTFMISRGEIQVRTYLPRLWSTNDDWVQGPTG